MLATGDTLPDLTITDDAGKPVKIAELLGGPLILYFYPKDDTPGCTNEASQFRDLYPQFEKKSARVVGVSRDPAASHQKFKTKYKIPFTLLADTESKLYSALGVNGRTTFLIDGNGTIVKVWPKVKVDGHADEVLASLP